MSRPDATVLLWALFMAILGAIAVVIFTPPGPETAALFAGVVVLMLVLGGGIAARRRLRPDPGDGVAQAIPDTSVATVWFVLAAAALLVGAELGLWLLLIGAGLVAVGVAGLVRESRASREAARRALGPDPVGAGVRVPGES